MAAETELLSRGIAMETIIGSGWRTKSMAERFAVLMLTLIGAIGIFGICWLFIELLMRIW
jgi:hypothetical protein